MKLLVDRRQTEVGDLIGSEDAVDFGAHVSTNTLLAALGDESVARQTRRTGTFFTAGGTALGPAGEPSIARDTNDEAVNTGLKESVKRAATIIRNAAVARSSTMFERARLEEVIKENRQRFAGCLMLVFSLLYFISYALAVSLHVHTTDAHLMELPFREVLVPSLAKVHEIPDVWRWLDGTVVPLFFKQTGADGEMLPQSEWSRVFTYNILQGAVVLEQTRSVRQACGYEIAAHVECYPQDVLSREPFGLPLAALPSSFNRSVLSSDEEGFAVSAAAGRRLRPQREELRRWLPGEGPPDATYKFFLHPTSPLAEVEQRVEYLRLRGWLDEQTTVLKVKALALNAEVGAPRVESIQITCSFSRGGGIFTAKRFETLFLRPMGGTVQTLASCVYALFMLVDSLLISRGLLLACRGRRLATYMLRSTTLVRCLSACLSWAILAGFVLKVSLLEAVSRGVERLASGGSGAGEVEAAAEDMHETAGQAIQFVSNYHILLTYMNFVLIYRVFACLKFQPQLAVVVHTLQATSVDLVHFFIILVPTFIAYALTGMCIFGRRIDHFASFQRAIGTCFKIAIENEFDWNSLSEEDFWTAASWVWTYVLLICLIMLNMVLAIIMDVYNQVRMGANGESVLETLKFSVTRLRLARRWVPDDVLLTRLAGMNATLTDAEFRRAMPAMTEEQAHRLLHAAKLKSLAAVTMDGRKASGTDMTAAIKFGMDKLLALLEDVRKQHERAAVAERTSDRTCAEDIMQSIAVQNHWMAFVQSQLNELRLKTKCFEGAENGQGDNPVDVD